ncbi:MAG: aldehyde dehydrogenase family protein [Armatimonadota bacterium]|nr:aldehyde dehydrogenase family protein [Armatimonadota bacterium]
MSLIHIPILRAGTVYESLDTVELAHIRSGEPIASVSQANAGLLRRDMARLKAARDALRRISPDELLEICVAAGELFLCDKLPIDVNGAAQSPQEYIEMLSATTGLPHSLCRNNMRKIHQVFTQMPAILRGLTRGLELKTIFAGIGEQAGVPVSFYPVTEALGVVLPSNSPGVNSIWMPAVVLGIPVVLKPGREDPWTPYRIIQAFLAAGCPREAFSFYPTDHEGSNTILNTAGRALVFGDESTVARYAANPGIQVHGPGRSKVLIGDDQIERWPEFVDVLVESIVSNGGRSCINASAVIVPAHGREIADALARRLAAIEPLAVTDEQATLAGFANSKVAEFIDEAINEDLKVDGAEDVTAKYRNGPRKVDFEGRTYLLPTIVWCDSFAHPLANREFLFPYASVVEMPCARMLDEIGPSLVVSAITRDAGFIERLLQSPLIDRLNLGALPTNRVSWDQPHEGNLFEFLYKRRAVQCE